MSDLEETTEDSGCGYCTRGVYQPQEQDVPEICPYCDGAGVPVPSCTKFCSPDWGDCEDPARFVVSALGPYRCEAHTAGCSSTELYPRTPEALALL